MTFGPMHILGLEGQPLVDLHLSQGDGLGHLEPGLDDRRLHPGPVVPHVPGQLDLEPANGPDAGDDPWDARTLEVDPVAAARVQLRRGAPRGGPRRLVAPQVHRGRRRPVGAADLGGVRRRSRRHRHRHPRGPRRAVTTAAASTTNTATASTSTCRARRTTRCCSASPCRSSATGSSTTGSGSSSAGSWPSGASSAGCSSPASE